MQLTLRDIVYRYPGQTSAILDGIDIHLGEGETVALMAPSGAGKSTLLAIAGFSMPPLSGTIEVNNHPYTFATARAAFRDHIAWIPQTANLLPRRSVLDNVTLPLLAAGGRRQTAETIAHRALESVGVGNEAAKQARRISGGEAQRVAVARALTLGARLIVADEPTANLDLSTARQTAEAIFRSTRDVTVLFATHDAEIAAMADRIVTLTPVD